MMKFFLLTLLSLNCATHASQDYLEVFKNIREQGGFAWPAPNSPSNAIASTFGPRTKKSTNGGYDFHRGIDIAGNIGEPVVAAHAGTVFYLREFVDGGLVMGLRHDLLMEFQVLPEKPSTKTFFTYYFHLNKFLAKEGDVVEAGDLIAELGETGGASIPHVHFEIRIGTACSLEFALNNPASTCNTFGYDPHVHPMVVHPPESNDLMITYNKDKSNDDEKFVLVSTNSNNPNIISYTISIIDRITGKIRRFHELDLNRRIGFDASSTAAIDSQDKTKPYLEPIAFNRDPTTWSTELVIPRVWYRRKIHRQQVHIEVTDVYGIKTQLVFGRRELWKSKKLRA